MTTKFSDFVKRMPLENQKRIAEGILNYIKWLQEDGELDSNCKTCIEVFYPDISEGKNIIDIHAPRHKASDNCKSGKHPHCTCDTCF